jgi:hypothetical protein
MAANPRKTGKQQAFVAMKFSGDSWNDKRYRAIKEVLEEAGYDAIRADEIPSSGGVVSEVCEYLQKATLVVIDSTGDSHSVSYEIGYCHGVNRDPATTILIRQGEGKDIPFNYRHFRHRCYKTPRHLKQLLRDCLVGSTRLLDNQFGYVLSFEVLKRGHYGPPVKTAVLRTLKYFDFSGRCEMYAGDKQLGPTHLYMIGLGLRFSRTKEPFPDLDWWQKFCERATATVEKTGLVKFAESCSEMGELGGIRYNLVACGVYEFSHGEGVKSTATNSVEEDASSLDALSGNEARTRSGESRKSN